MLGFSPIATAPIASLSVSVALNGALLFGSATLVAQGGAARPSSIQLSGSSAISPRPSAVRGSSANLNGISSLTANGGSVRIGASLQMGSASIYAAPKATINGSTSLTGTATIEGLPTSEHLEMLSNPYGRLVYAVELSPSTVSDRVL